MANFFDQFDAAPTAPPPASTVPVPGGNFFDQFDAPGEAPPAPVPAGAVPMPDPVFNFGANQEQQSRNDQLLGRGVIQGLGGGFLGLPALAIDAGRNAAYGAKSLAAKTGLVEAPDPKNYYGESDSYIPTATAASQAVSGGLDRLGFAKPKTGGERMVSAGVEGIAGGVGGVGLGNVVASGGSALAKRVGGFLAAQPEIQSAAGATAGLASQGVTEAGGTNTASMAAGLLAGGATGLMGAKAVQRPGTPVPTLDDLRAAKDTAYQRSEAAGAAFTPQAVEQLDRRIRADLPNQGIFLDTNLGARGVVDPLSRSHAADALGNRAPVSLTRMDDIRRQAGDLYRSQNPVEQRTGSILAGHIDDFLDNLQPSQVAAGNVDEAVGFLREGQAANRRLAKATTLHEAIDRATLRAATTHSGQNFENASRQNLRDLIKNPRSAQYRQFDPDERELIRGAAEGSTAQNVLRWGGRAAPTGNVSGLMALAAASHGWGAIPAAGIAAKAAGGYLHSRRLQRLEDYVRGGPGAGRRPRPDFEENTARGTAQGFLAGQRAREEEKDPLQLTIRSRYR